MSWLCAYMGQVAWFKINEWINEMRSCSEPWKWMKLCKSYWFCYMHHCWVACTSLRTSVKLQRIKNVLGCMQHLRWRRLSRSNGVTSAPSAPQSHGSKVFEVLALITDCGHVTATQRQYMWLGRHRFWPLREKLCQSASDFGILHSCGPAVC